MRRLVSIFLAVLVMLPLFAGCIAQALAAGESVVFRIGEFDEDTWYCQYLRQQGIVPGSLGNTNVTEDDIRQALEVAPIDAVQVQYSLVDRAAAEPLFDFITENKITLVTWGSLAQGLLTGKYDATARFEKSDRRSMYGNFVGKKFSANMQTVQKLKQISAEIGKTPSQIAIRWLLDTKPVGSVLFGAKRPAQVEDNLGADGWELAKKHYGGFCDE